jgi:uncharacterized protein YnzC (UPF0291/DUF896 family)
MENNIFSREEIRRLEKAAKDKNKQKLLDWAISYDDQLRKEYDKAFKDELKDSIDNFCTAIAYTARFSETSHLSKKKIPEFMEDLFSTIDMFRLGEYLPKEYEEELLKCGIKDINYHVKDRKYKTLYICADMNYTGQDEIISIYTELSEKYICLLPTFLDIEPENILEEKIKMSNTVYVLNDMIISDPMKYQIEYAKKLRKTIIYYKEVDDGN